jgi:hypothetical protein
LAPNNDIEDRFASAVKAALEASGTVKPPVDVVEPPVEVVKPPVEVVKPPVEMVEPPVEMVEPPVEMVKPPVETTFRRVQAEPTKRTRVWAIALLCLAFAAIAIVVVAAVLHVRRADVARLAAEATRTEGAFNQPNATVVAPESTAASESTAIVSGPTIAAAPEAPSAAASASTAVTPSDRAEGAIAS